LAEDGEETYVLARSDGRRDKCPSGNLTIL
jgi:hypothetical protein